MKTELTREQNQHLIDLGVPKEKASLVAVKQICDWQRKPKKNPKEYIVKNPHMPVVMGFEEFEKRPIFTLADLIGILPNKVDGCNRMIESSNECHYAYYCCSYGRIGNLNQSEELIDSVYGLTIWCIENKHLKFG